MIKILLKFSTLILTLFFSFFCFSQTPTVGLRYMDSNVTEGYTLFTPQDNNNVYLINNCGEVMNEWEFTEKPGATCYLLEDGNLLRAGKESLEIRDWNNDVVWTFSLSSIGLNQHHDIEPLPNGNILCVVADLYSDSEMIAQGRNPLKLDSNFKLDKIVEIQPIGNNDGKVVWEWKFIDHLIQDFDSTKLNFGDVASHPELIDINFDNNQNKNYTHVNGIDYNASLDQIIISTRHLNEIHIIDHSVTTAEAKGHSMGNFNKGGDILWRWGNPQVYKQGTALDQKLFFQHDSKWVEKGYLDEGKITVFNNLGDGTRAFSSIHLIEPVILNNSYMKENGVFLPIDFEWSWNGSIFGNVVLEVKKSGTHALPNGNFIICETSKGQVSEINKNGDVLWVYKNPSGKIKFNQFEEPEDNFMFRAEKYPADYIGFSQYDMTSKNIIEDENTISNICIENKNTNEFEDTLALIVNPVEDGTIKFTKNVDINTITILDISGRMIYKYDFFSGNSLEINLSSGIYFIQLKFDSRIETQTLLIL